MLGVGPYPHHADSGRYALLVSGRVQIQKARQKKLNFMIFSRFLHFALFSCLFLARCSTCVRAKETELAFYFNLYSAVGFTASTYIDTGAVAATAR